MVGTSGIAVDQQRVPIPSFGVRTVEPRLHQVAIIRVSASG